MDKQLLLDDLADLLVEACADRDTCFKALGIALGALQTVQAMEPVTHEITTATVMAQHALDAINDIKELARAPDDRSH